MQHGSKKLQKEEFLKSICHKTLSSFSCSSTNGLEPFWTCWESSATGRASGVASLGSLGGQPH